MTRTETDRGSVYRIVAGQVSAERIRDKIAASKRKGLWMGGNVPLGYQADGRTLKIDAAEAATIRCLYEFYLKHGAIREVKEHADELGLRSRQRLRGAGRIRHKGQVYEGQHPAIIAPMIWEQVQQMLAGGAIRARGTRRVSARSLLTGKLFDETGDRLTPSHSKKNGQRLRCYISHRMVMDRSRKYPDAWRLPAEQVEGLISDLIRAHLKQEDIAIRLIRDLNASQVEAATFKLHAIQQTKDFLILVGRADLSPGVLTIHLHRDELTRSLDCDPKKINQEQLILKSPFRMRRRGVELRLHLGEAPAEIDTKLLQNVVNAHKWIALIISGMTFAEIAEAECTSKRRIQDVVDLAMLAPHVLDAIAAGEQPEGLTSDYLTKTGLPAIWSEQRAQFAKL